MTLEQLMQECYEAMVAFERAIRDWFTPRPMPPAPSPRPGLDLSLPRDEDLGITIV